MPKFPGVLLNNNPNAPSIDLNDLQVKGVGIFADVAERDALDANIQTEGYLAIMKDDDTIYVYKGGGWSTTSNWDQISGKIQILDGDGTPSGNISTLTVPDGNLSIVGDIATLTFNGLATSTQLAALQSEVDSIETAIGLTVDGNAPTTTAGDFLISDGTNFGVSAYSLPVSDGTVGQYIQTDGNGALSFATISATLEGLTDTPSGYGTAGQVLITNGVDGFTFGSGSPWVSDTNGITYTAGNVGIGTASDSGFDLNVGSGIILGAGQLLFNSVSDGIRLQSVYNTTAGVGIGFQALASGGPGAVAIGNRLNSPSSGTVVIGYSGQQMSGYTATDPRAVHIGHSAGMTATTATDTVAIGNGPLSSLTTGSGNLAIGRTAGSAITTQSYNTFIGYEAGRISTGSGNTFIGKEAGEFATTGINNTAIGTQAGQDNTTGTENVFIGYVSGDNYTGSGSVLIGRRATATSGLTNARVVAIGYGASVSGARGVAIGSSSAAAGGVSIGTSQALSNEISIGASAGQGRSASEYGHSVFIGYSAGLNSSGSAVIIGGVNPATNASLGGSIGIGNNVWSNASVSSSVAIGYSAGRGASGDRNVYIGDDSGRGITGGDNVILGDHSSSVARSVSASVFIGKNSGDQETTSNKLYIANSNTTTPLIYGDFNDGYVTINKNGTDKISFYAGSHAYQISDADYAGNFVSGGVTNAKGLYILFEGTNLEQSGPYRAGGLLIGRAWDFGAPLNIANGVILGNRITATATSGNSWLPGILIGNGVDLGNQNHAGGVLIGNFSPSGSANGVTIHSETGTKPSASTSSTVIINSTSGSTANEAICIGGRAMGYNVSIGVNAQRNSTGNNPGVFVGRDAGRYENGQSSTIIGSGAGYNINGGNNTLLGNSAGYGTTGIPNNSTRFNTGLGSNALRNISNGGSGNTAVGYQAGLNVGAGDNNVFAGYNAGYNSSGSERVFIGFESGGNTTAGPGVSIGSRSSSNTTDVDLYSTAIGHRSMTHGSRSTIIGGGAEGVAGSSNTTAVGYGVRANIQSVALGSSARSFNQRNVIIGHEATDSSNDRMICIGWAAGKYASGNDNVIIGDNDRGHFGYSNIAIGAGAGGFKNGASDIGTYQPTKNVLIGRSVTQYGLAQVTSNVLIGDQVARNNSGPIEYNVVIGQEAGRPGSGSEYSGIVALGYQAGNDLTSATNSVLIGKQAGSNITTGTGNVMIGEGAGTSVVTGSGNVMLGTRAGYSETGSDKLYIANSSTTTPLIYGEFDTNHVKINGSHAGGAIGFWPGNSVNNPVEISDQAYLRSATSGGVSPSMSILFNSSVNVGSYSNNNLLIGTDFNIATLGQGKLILGASITQTTTGNSSLPKMIIGNNIDLGTTNNNAGGIVIGLSGTLAENIGSGVVIGGDRGSFNGVAIKATSSGTSGSQGGTYIMGEPKTYSVIIGGPQGAGIGQTGNGQKVIVGNAAGNSSSAHTAIGGYAAHSSTGSYITAVGSFALGNAGVGGGSATTAIGQGAGQNSTGNNNTFIGALAAGSNTTGGSNVAVGGGLGAGGAAALVANTTGSNNAAIGVDSLRTAVSASYNIGIGRYSGYKAGGSNNIFLGYRTAWVGTDNDTNITNNVVIGHQAGYNTAGSGNVFVGEGAGFNATGTGNVMLGTRAGYSETGSNRLYISSGQGTDLVYGEFDNDFLKVNGDLEVTGSDGLILNSPNGTRYKVTVSDAGVLSTSLA